MMEWSDIRLFLAIAREGTLGAAARKLGLTQPTMGRRLKTLERAVGHSLFQRTPDGFILTDEGTVALGHAERMEEEVMALQRQLAGTENTLSGHLRISCSDWFGVHVLAPVLCDFTRVHPNVIIEVLTDSRMLNLARREAELVLRIKPFTEPDVISRKLLHIPYGLYVAKEADDPSPGTGGGVNMITMDEAFGSMPDVIWLKGRFPDAHVSMRSNNRDVQARLCAGGAGMAVLPRPLGDSMDSLRHIDLSEPPPGRDTWLGYHQDLRRLPRLRAFTQFVGDYAKVMQSLK